MESNTETATGGSGIEVDPQLMSAIEKLLNDYAEKIDSLRKERDKKVDDIEFDEEEDYEEWRKKKKMINEIYEEYDEKEYEALEELEKKLEKMMEKTGEKYEVVLEIVDDCELGSGMYFEQRQEEMLVLKIYKQKDVITVSAVFTYGCTYGEDYFVLEKMSVNTEPLIDEETTPFTQKLVNEIPWNFIRDEWAPSISDMIQELAIRERDGELEEGIKELEEKLTRGRWIYDFEHVLKALHRAMCQT